MAEENGNALAEQVAKLSAKNQELMGELREKAEALKRFDGVDLEELQTAAQKLQEVEENKQKEIGEYKTLYEKQMKKNQEAMAELESKSSTVLGLQKEIEINKVMPNVFPEMRDLALQNLSKEIRQVDNKLVGPNGEEIKSFVSDWFNTDLGKRFIPADNAGGGASGSGSGKTDPDLGFFKKGGPEYNLTRQAQIRKVDPERANKLDKLANS